MSVELDQYKFKIGVGNGLSAHIRACADANQLFPDGMVGSFVRREGALYVELLNRRSGKKWVCSSYNAGIWQTTFSSQNNKAEFGIEPFSSVYPESVERITGGLRLRLPDTLKPPIVRGKFRKVGQPAEEEAELQGEANPTPDLPAEQLSLERIKRKPTHYTRVVTDPAVSLAEAVQAINLWKQKMGDSLQLRLDSSSGKLRAVAEYGE